MIIPSNKQARRLEELSPSPSPTTSEGIELTRLNPRSSPPPLNPGHNHRSSRTNPGWRFFAWATAAACLLFVCKWTIDTVQHVLDFNSIHTGMHLYRNESSIAQVKNRKTVVQPLLEEDDLFDVAVVVWARTVDPTVGWPWDKKNVKEVPASMTYFDYGRTLFFPGARTQLGSILHAPGSTVMKPVYAEVPAELRGLSMGDLKLARVSTAAFAIPKDLLCNSLVRPNDLLGALTILPHSPSKLDNATGISSYIPDTTASRFELFPPSLLQSFGLTEGNEWTVRDSILHSISIARPLLEFHSDPSYSFQDQEDEDDFSPKSPKLNLYEDAIPFFHSRTYIHLVKETRLLDKKVFRQQQEKLRERVDACLHLTTVKGSMDDFDCYRIYHMNAPFETLAGFHGLDEGLEYAYGPYLDINRNAVGPKDLKKLPFDRQTCRPPSIESIEEFIRVKWKLVFTLMSPRTHILTGFMGPKPEPIEPDHIVIQAQDKTELWNSVYGLPSRPETHPKRRIFIYTLGTALSFPIALLRLDYWYKRTTTKGISIIGTSLLVAASLGTLFRDVLINTLSTKSGPAKPSEMVSFIGIVIKLLTELPLPLLMLRTMFRVTMWRDKRWLFMMDGATHGERTSMRLDERQLKGWKGRLGALCSLAVVYYFILPHKEHIISTLLPDPPTDHLSFPEKVLRQISEALIDPLLLVAQASQLTLNHAYGTFGGNYWITAILLLVVRALNLIIFVPSVVGRFESRPALTAQDVLDTATVAVAAFQALTLPGVPQNDPDDEAE